MQGMKYLIVAAMAAGLAACGSGGGSADADGDGKVSNEEAAKAVSSVKLEHGQWDNTVEFVEVDFDESKLPPEARGMASAMLKGMAGRTISSSSCMTPEEAEKPEAGFLAGQEDNDCTYNTFEMSGGKMNVDMVCKSKEPGQGDARIKMNGTYQPDQYVMEMDMVTTAGEMGEMKIKAKTKGRRTGACEG